MATNLALDDRLLERLRDRLGAFPDELLIQGANTDFLLCAAAIRHRMPQLTTDADFNRFAAVIPLALHSVAG